ncbi:origin recognition complex subunit 4 [Boothiomyces macroporosus]|uniref:Origin recognition complex subunit 4 n=1 Tax=Boothiomyces macroporosus TaxID=261099 RepID=A0AAD5UIV2_9FUNG|nr:origin recognition complex subunit 4 [Boothiomyces macroporosus]
MTIQTKKLVGLDSQQNQLNELLKRTVSFGESNSVLVTGQKGSGKTTLVNNALASLSNHTFYTIKLDGIYHTDDALALKSIIRQLQLELDLETQTSGSFAERLEFVISTLKSGNQDTVPIVFIVEELDLFCFHNKQILLYNLFDVSQSNQTPICVVGTTCRIDTLLILEKRVKSRFSHRTINIYPVATFEEYLSIAEELGSDMDENVGKLLKDKQSMVSQYQLLNGKYPTSKIFADLIDVKNQDQMEQTIHELSILEICILLSIKGLLSKQHELFNFEMVYDEYREFAKRLAALGKGMGRLHFTKSVALKAYENLACLGLICNSSGIASQCPKEYHMARCLLTRLQIRNALATYPDVLPSAIMKWAET